MAIKKLEQIRPPDCIYGTRVGDRVEIDGKLFLEVKCKSCSRLHGRDVFHYIKMGNDT